MNRRYWAIAAVLAALLGSGIYASQRTSAKTRPLIVTAAVTRRDVQDQVTLSGTLGRLAQRTVAAPMATQVSDVSVKDGQIVRSGQSIVALNGRQMVAEPGSVPFTRPLSVGDQGGDVRQLDEILAADGYNPGPPGTVFGNQTQAALAQWQAAHGYPGLTANKPSTLTISLQPSGAYRLGPLSTAGLVIGPPSSAAGQASLRRSSPGSPLAELTDRYFSNAQPSPTLTIEALNPVTPKGSPAVFIVYASRTSTMPVTFTVSRGGDAPDDEVLPPIGPFTIPPGANSVQVQVPTRLNGLVQADSYVTLQLQPGTAYQVGSPSAAAATIQSSDVPQLALTGGGVVAAGNEASFTISADQPPVHDTSVVLQVAGTAQPGQDFVPLSSTVLLPAGRQSVNVALQTINRNVVFEPTDMLTGSWPIRIGQVAVKPGDAVPPGGELFTLTDTNFTVTLSASPSDRTQLRVGQTATVQLQGGSTQANGVISQLDDNVTVDPDSKAQTYKGKIAVGNLGAADGATVSITVTVQAANNVLTVPIAAVKQNGLGRDVVRVIDLAHGGRVSEVPVTTGLADGSYIEIDRGLSEGQVVIVETDTIKA